MNHPVLLLNGASGTGKTSVARRLMEIGGAARLHWVHPDALWDTPDMRPMEIMHLALARAAALPDDTRLVIIDTQIRSTDARRCFGIGNVTRFACVLLHCARAERERRLIVRGWKSTEFERIHNWADVLQENAEREGDLFLDSARHDVDTLARRVLRHVLALELPRTAQCPREQ